MRAESVVVNLYQRSSSDKLLWRFTCLWIFGLLSSACVHASSTLVTNDDLKTALHDVLSHGNLFDVEYVSQSLDFALHTSRPQSRGSRQSYALVVTHSPPVIYGNASYVLVVDGAEKSSSASITVIPRQCPGLSVWASEWGLETRSSPIMDADGSVESLVWPGAEGVSLSFTSEGDGCVIQVQQTFKRIMSIPAIRPIPIAPEIFAERIADLLVREDLRDFERTEGILHAEFVVAPATRKHRFLRNDLALLARPIEGFRSDGFFYGASDGGWVSWANSLGGVPTAPHLAERSANLSLTIDTDSVCLSQEQFAAALQLRTPPLQVERGSSGAGQNYTVHRGANRISLVAEFDESCMRSVNFDQVTDFRRSIGAAPIIFVLKDSLRPHTHVLTDAARDRFQLIAERLRSGTVGGVQIKELPGADASDAVRRDLATLQRLLKEAVVNIGIGIKPESEDDEGWCGRAIVESAPSVCLDVWLKRK